MERKALFWTFCVSVVLHAAILFVFSRAPAARSSEEKPSRSADAWVGRTLDVEAALEHRVEASPSPETPTPKATAAEPVAHDSIPERAHSASPSPTHAASPTGAQARPTAARSVAPAGRPRATPERAEAGPVERAEFGSEGLPAGVRRLVVAFTRAVPAATSHDPVWRELPFGTIGTARASIELDGEGRIVHVDALEREHTPSALQHLIERTVLLLRGGRFALSLQSSPARTEILRIQVQISQREPASDFEPDQPIHLGFEPPERGRRGRAFFTLGSGRHVEAWISVEGVRG